MREFISLIIGGEYMNSYFSHDSNARNSDKLLPVRMKFGAEGYGIYFMILERLREEKNYMSVKDYNMIAFDLRVDSGKVKSLVEDFGLFAFTDDGECFYSEGFLKRMEFKDEKSKKRSIAGKKGAEKRWQKNGNAIAKPITNDSKESKENKSKGNKSKASSIPSLDLNPDSACEFWLNQVNPAEAPTVLKSIDYWVSDFNGQELIVIEAIKEMLRNNAKSYKYLNKILKTWESKGLNTPQKVAKYLQGHYSKALINKRQKLEYENLDEYADL